MSSAVIKNTAYITMFIDHFAAIILVEAIRKRSVAGYETDELWEIYSVGRAIGRIAFVLFAYLCVEGFTHTRSRRNYLLRLGGFAFVSEAPFDLAFSGRVVDHESQNIFFTLFLGVLVMTVWEGAGKKIQSLKGRKKPGGFLLRTGDVVIWRMVQIGALASGCAAAYYLRTDYKYMGVCLIAAFYCIGCLQHRAGRPRSLQEAPHKSPAGDLGQNYPLSGGRLILGMVLAGCVLFIGTWSMNYLQYKDSYSAAYLFQFSLRELYGLLAFLPISLYDGRKGRQLPKAVCYGFYPVHLLLLYGVARVI